MKKLLLAACLAACALAQQPSAAPVLEGKTLRPANSDDLRMLGILSSSARQAAQKTGRHNPEMEKLSAAAFAAYGKQDFTASFRYVTRYLFGIQGTPVSEATEIATAYDLKLDRKILTPGAALRISLVPLFTLDRPLAGKYTVGLSIRSAEGNKVRPLDEQELTDMRNVEVTFKDKLAPGSYTVHYELRTAGGAL
ncbi:MAG: hypothetical protein HYR60_28325, partial [Acidobacteria bacterium]|nr:hypothetical protein [Acidobacteriota bacterium]